MKKFTSVVLALSMFALMTGCSNDNVSENTENGTPETSTVEVDTTSVETEEAIEETEPSETEPIDPSMLEYQLVWADEFDGEALDEKSWNYEVVSPGWVNNELQSYVKGDECVFIDDGQLVIQPVKIVDEETGEVSYHSGRINTKRNHEFKYGRIEASIKFPEGQGFLPAFWMMPKSETIYGSWPRCGEIDISEVLGHETDTTYGTIHFGNPHVQSQFKMTLDEGSFSSDFHTFAIEWEPGVIKWFVDDVEIGCEQRWFTAFSADSPQNYPAPFNQDFYIILNLAVGGDWPGSPDETTKFDESSQMRVDWVRVYQRGYYDENVTLPEEEYSFKEAGADGNYISADNWDFLLFDGGVAAAEVGEESISILTAEAGNVDYSVQLVQAGLPAKSGTTYEVSFEAKASEERTFIVDVSAPDKGYIRYMEDEKVTVGTDWNTYTFTYTITGDSDDNSRLEFNLGHADSTADVTIRNVVVKEAN